MSSNLARFKRVFSGLDRAHGQYKVKSKEKSGKHVGSVRTVKKAPTDKEWSDHLEGRVGIGIVPIRGDGSCMFGAIDVDVYDLDLPSEEAKIRALGLPLTVCRTKSGGAHLYLFMKKPARASLIRIRLAEWAAALGRPGAEIFPKQDHLRDEDDVGSWINLPYFGGDRTTRYAVVGGSSKTLEEFLDHAERVAIGPKDLKDARPKSDDMMAEGPPCLQAMLAMGVGEGNRNETLFALGVFAKKKNPEGWDSDLREMNAKYFDPPLSEIEMDGVIKSLDRKDYIYPCKRPAMAGLCNRSLCLQRKFGIKGESNDPGVTIENLRKIKTDPPSWVLDVNDVKIQLDSTDDLLSQKKFNTMVVDAMNILPQTIKAKIWEDLVQRLLAEVIEIDAPEDAGRTGQFLSLVDYFLTERPKARSREELLLGKCLAENGRVFFRSGDLMKFLDVNKFKITPKESWNTLRARGAEAARFKIKGRSIRCWSLSADHSEVEIDPTEHPDLEF